MSKSSQVGLIYAMCFFSTFAVAKGERYGASVNMITVESIDYDEGSSGDVDAYDTVLFIPAQSMKITTVGAGGLG